MRKGKIHLDHPSCGGGTSRLPPGRSMQRESQTSPRTFAKEVKISANITSEKYMGALSGEKRHLRIELFIHEHQVTRQIGTAGRTEEKRLVHAFDIRCRDI